MSFLHLRINTNQELDENLCHFLTGWKIALRETYNCRTQRLVDNVLRCLSEKTRDTSDMWN